MTTNSEEIANDEINWRDIRRFFHRRKYLFPISFTLLFSTSAVYFFSQPTLYQVKASLLIGERFFFVTNQAQISLIESPEQIKYRFPNITITPIKNTRVIEIISKREHANEAQAEVENCLQEILRSHAIVLQNKRLEFLKFLEVSKPINKESMELIDSATSSSASKQYAATSVIELPFSGLLLKGLGIGFIVSLFLAFVISLIADRIQTEDQSIN